MSKATGAFSFLTLPRLALAALALVATLAAAPALAQDASSSAAAGASATAVADDSGLPPLPGDTPTADQVAHGLEVWKDRGGCFNCHGDFAQGGTGGHFPAGPSLRKTQLDLASLRDIVSCGIPGTPMPYNFADGYSKVSCYGSDLGPAPQGTAPGAALSAAEITDLIAYLKVDVIGQRRITKKECVDYYGDPNYPDCAAYH
jgi:hypothetical protein